MADTELQELNAQAKEIEERILAEFEQGVDEATREFLEKL